MYVKVISANVSDAKRLAEVYNLSFYSDYVKYGECPGYNRTEESMLSRMKAHDIYKIVTTKNLIVGAISVKKEPDNHYFLCALCVIPEYANKGIGQQAMIFLDEKYPDAVHWTLETPTDKIENHYFYKKFGYIATKEYMDGNVSVSLLERGCQDNYS